MYVYVSQMIGVGHCDGVMDKKGQPMTNGVGLSRGGLAPEVPLFPSKYVCARMEVTERAERRERMCNPQSSLCKHETSSS